MKTLLFAIFDFVPHNLKKKNRYLKLRALRFHLEVKQRFKRTELSVRLF